jgi:TolB-like protein
MANLFSELKRRNVVRVGIAYVVLGWVALQAGDILFDMFGTPDWIGKTLAALLFLGLPFACLFAWAFEMTPEGVKKTAEVDRSESITHSTGKNLNFVIMGALVIALGYFILERQSSVDPAAEVEPGLEKSIAVLPFVNMSSDEEQEWFVDGLTEEILNSLARTPDLLVASRTSSFQYKGKSEDISTIAAALGVAHILEGSVRRGGDRLRVTAQLIRAHDGFHLWSETFDREPKDVIEIQENVAFEIANALKTAMDPEALQRMVSSGTASVAAYEAYLEASAYDDRSGATGNIEDWVRALNAYDRAVAADDTFALAHWGRALYWEGQLTITQIGSELSSLSFQEKVDNYSEAIDAAIAYVQNEALGFKFKANKARNEFRFGDGQRYLLSYLQTYPNDTEGQAQLATIFASIRDKDGAAPYVQRFLESSLDDPLEINALLNNILFIGLVDDAVHLARDAVQRYPQHAFLHYQSHRVLLWAGHTEEASALIDQVRRSELPAENIRIVLMRQACAEGDRALAEQLLGEAVELSDRDTSIEFIGLQTLGRPDEAHQLLVDAELDNWALASFLNYPYFDHTYFPEIAGILEQQGIDRPFINGPPYACKADQS